MSYEVLPPLVHHPQHPVTALAFDPVSDILWSGSSTGTVSAHYGSNYARGIAFPASAGQLRPVNKISVLDKDVRASTETGVGSWAKGGANKWYYKSPQSVSTFVDHPTLSNSLVVASSSDPEFSIINSATGAVVRQIPAPPIVTHLRASHSLLISGDSNGFLRTHDLRMNSRKDGEASIMAHIGGIQGLDVSGSFVYSCGWGIRQARPYADPLVKVFDLRVLKPLPPIPFQLGPSHILVHPNKSSTLVIVSSQGSVNMVDVLAPHQAGNFHQLTIGSYITSTAFSPTGAYIALGDAEGCVHFLSSITSEEGHLPWNGFEGHPVPWADSPDTLPEIEWTSSTPLNSIGMPHYSTPLLSGSASLSHGSSYHPPPAKIPQQVLNSMRTIDFVGYATLPKELRGKRNVAPKEVISKDEGRFRSKVGRGAGGGQPPSPSVDKFQRPEIPKYWRKTDIKYSKFGIEDFDFGFYNKTSYSGLETHIMNSYTNAIVQAFFYSVPMRRHAKSHITIACQREHCLLCEFGFVSRMLEDAKGTNCQTSNFCKIIGRMPQAVPLGLVDYTTEGNSQDYATMIQQFNRFLLEEMASEGDTTPSNPLVVPTTLRPAPKVVSSPVTQFFGIDWQEIITCGHCGASKEKEQTSRLIDLIYPRKDQITATSATKFVDLLATSLNRDTTYKATCRSCKHLATFRSKRRVPHNCLPALLSVNAAVFTDDQLHLWLDSTRKGNSEKFLSSEVALNLEGDDEKPVMYDLRAMVVEVRVGPKSAHLAAVIKIPTGELDDPSASPWFVFNDFVVENITENEALSFSSQWKVPCVLYFERRDFIDELDYSGLPMELDPAILGQLTSMAKNMNPAKLKHEVLRFEELPTPGTVVAIDAEFVALQQEESEFRSDGTKKVIRPSQLTLARVSVLRGNGPKSGKPFIDDYIHTTDTIVDYLTEYSGITYGDLDPIKSPHTLLPLKVVYKKMRLLVDLGCIFIGHGLSKDFRIINLFVPPEQVIDTVDLYFIRERQRRISLRFLSWYLLKETIQIDTHDSIEDARAALLLYQKYQEYEEEGRFDDVLEEIYREGRKHNWKAPTDEGTTSTPSKPSTPFPSSPSPTRPGVMANPMMNPSAFLPNIHPAFSPPPHLQGLPINFMDPRVMFAASWSSTGLTQQPQSPPSGRR